MGDISRRVQFYAWSEKENKRRIFSFKVTNVGDARQALKRFGIPAGYYVEKNKITGAVLKNMYIRSA